METADSLPSSLEPATRPYGEKDKFNPHLPILFFLFEINFNIIAHLCLSSKRYLYLKFFNRRFIRIHISHEWHLFALQMKYDKKYGLLFLFWFHKSSRYSNKFVDFLEKICCFFSANDFFTSVAFRYFLQCLSTHSVFSTPYSSAIRQTKQRPCSSYTLDCCWIPIIYCMVVDWDKRIYVPLSTVNFCIIAFYVKLPANSANFTLILVT